VVTVLPSVARNVTDGILECDKLPCCGQRRSPRGARIFVASQFIVNRFPAEKNDQTLCTLRQKETCDCVVVLDVVRGATLGGITWKVALRCSHHESP